MPWGRYLIRHKGVVEVTFDSFAMCHTRVLPGGEVVRGAQGNFPLHYSQAWQNRNAVKRKTAQGDESLRADYSARCFEPAWYEACLSCFATHPL